MNIAGVRLIPPLIAPPLTSVVRLHACKSRLLRRPTLHFSPWLGVCIHVEIKTYLLTRRVFALHGGQRR